MQDIRTSNGWYREVKRFGRTIERLYCGDNMNTWLVLTGDPGQGDVEEEIEEALVTDDYTIRFDFRVRA